METKELPELRFAGPTSEAAWREAEAQGSLAPGEPGWWKVWGARVLDIRAGDMVLWQSKEGWQEVMLVESLYRAKSYPMRWGVVVEGTEQTVGSLMQIVLLRKGTSNTLADSI